MEIEEKIFQTSEDARGKMIHALKFGEEHGSTTHVPTIDSVWKWRMTELTLVTGYNNQGKSQLLQYLTLIKCIKDGYKACFYSPEGAPIEYFYGDFASMLTGKSTLRNGRNPLSQSEYNDAISLLNNKIFFINIKQAEATIENVLEKFRIAHLEHGCNVFVIDPILKINRQAMDGREDLFAGHITGMLTEFARKYKVALFMVMHQLGAQINPSTMTYNAPDQFKIKGGSGWGDGSDNVLSVHRPMMPADFKDTTVVFSSLKIKKQRLVAIPGKVEFKYDRDTGNYTDGNNRPLFDFSPYLVLPDQQLF